MTTLQQVRTVLPRMTWDRERWVYRLEPKDYADVLAGLAEIEEGRGDTDTEGT